MRVRSLRGTQFRKWAIERLNGGVENRAALVSTTASDIVELVIFLGSFACSSLPQPSAMLSGIDSDARLRWSVSTPLPLGYVARIVVARLLFDNNVALAQSLFREPSMGTLVPGAPADLCVVDYDAPTPLTPSTFDGHLVFGITEAPVLATVIGGRVRVVRGVFMELDATKIRSRVLKAAESVWKRLEANEL